MPEAIATRHLKRPACLHAPNACSDVLRDRAVVKDVQGLFPSSVLLAAGWSLGGASLKPASSSHTLLSVQPRAAVMANQGSLINEQAPQGAVLCL